MAGSQDRTPGAVVKDLVCRIPTGRSASYGTVARAALALGRPIGGARTVAWILAALKGRDDTPWHRVVGAGGKILLPDRRGALQISRLRREGVRFFKGVIEPRFLIDELELLASMKNRRAPARGFQGGRVRVWPAAHAGWLELGDTEFELPDPLRRFERQ